MDHLSHEQKKIFHELIHVDFPLAMGQLTWEGETVRNLPWTQEAFTYHPYCLFQRKNGLLYYLYDPEGMAWKIEQAGTKADRERMKAELLNFYEKIEDTITQEPALSKKELKNFTDILRESWTWWDCLWWLIEYDDKHGNDISDLLAIRKRTEHLAPGIANTLRNSIRNLVPLHAAYADILLLEEVMDNDIPEESILQIRQNECIYGDGKIWNNLKEVCNTFELIIEPKEKSSGELKGTVAYAGKAKGKVKIISRREDLPSFKVGEILVSSTTTPDFLPAMKIAGGIISEHGGAICHASITSRELKIPCIVGVKGATSILKDGDEVELDANNGIIKILNRAS